MKKRSYILALSLLLAISLIPAGVFASTDPGTQFYATVSPSELFVSSDGQQVTVTVNADREVLIDGLSIDFDIPKGWEVVSISNSEIKFTGDDYALRVGDSDIARVCWSDAALKTMKTTNMAVVTFKVPANAAAGTYYVSAHDFELTHNFGDIWLGDYDLPIEIVIKGSSEGGSGSSDTPAPQPTQQPTPSDSSTDPAPSGSKDTDPAPSPSEGTDGEKKDDQNTPSDPEKDQSGGVTPDKEESKGSEGSSGSEKKFDMLFPIIGGIALVILIILLVLTRKKKK